MKPFDSYVSIKEIPDLTHDSLILDTDTNTIATCGMVT